MQSFFLLISNIILLWSHFLYIILILWKFLKLLRCATQHMIYFRLLSMCTWICILILLGTVLHRSPLGEVSSYCYSSFWYPHFLIDLSISEWGMLQTLTNTVDLSILSVLSVLFSSISLCFMYFEALTLNAKHLGLLSLLEKMVLLSFMKYLSLSLVLSWNHFTLFYN